MTWQVRSQKPRAEEDSGGNEGEMEQEIKEWRKEKEEKKEIKAIKDKEKQNLIRRV